MKAVLNDFFSGHRVEGMQRKEALLRNAIDLAVL